MTRVIRRWPIAASSLAAVVIAACGSGNGEGSAKTTRQSDSAPDGAALQAFTECMRQQGVDVPEPSQGGPRQGPGNGRGFDPNDEDAQKALERCRGELPENGPPRGGPPAAEQAPG
jgi:hypothetical protein